MTLRGKAIRSRKQHIFSNAGLIESLPDQTVRVFPARRVEFLVHERGQVPSIVSLEPTLAGRIVVVHQGALGDFLLTVPVLEALHRSYPLIQLDLWSKPEHVALLAEKPFMGNTPPPDDSALFPFFRDELWHVATIPRFLEDARAILIFGQAGSRVLGERLSARLPCPVHWLQSFPGPGSCQHVHQFLLKQCRRLGWPLGDGLPQLKPSAHDLASAQAGLREHNPTGLGKPIFIHPGSGGLRKIWPLSNWWMLLRFLRGSYPYPVFLTLGPADERLRNFARAAEALGVATLEGLSLPLLTAWLSQGQFFVGSDSGVSHLAALVGIPAVVIFGPTDPRVWAPRGANVHIVEATWEETEVLAWPPVSANTSSGSSVIEQVRRILQTVPKRGLLAAER